MSNTINADNGVVSGIAGVKLSSDSTGVLDIQTNGTTAITISTAQVVSLTNSPTFTGGTANGVLYLNASKVATSGSALVFDGTNLGIGTTSPAAKLNVDAGSAGLMSVFDSTNANGGYLLGRSSGTAVWDLGTAKQALNVGGATDFGINVRSGFMALGTGNTERARIDSSGNLGLGVTPSVWDTVASRVLQLNGGSIWSYSTSQLNLIQNAFYNTSGDLVYTNTAAASSYRQISGVHSWNVAASGTAGNTITFTQAMTLDASGNLGLGATTTAGGRLVITQNNSVQPAIYFPTDESTIQGPGADTQIRMGGNLTVQSGGQTTIAAKSASGIIVFQTDSTPTERARITSGGDLLVGQTTNALADTGHILDGDGIAYHITNGITCLTVNRKTSDGTLVDFLQDGVSEGTISVSGTTVSYNGGHLSRYSQTTNNTRIPLLKGTVMSNLDQMAVWEKDGEPLPNEQLNCMKVSGVEGDVNVAGVFVNWDNDDDVYTNDMNIAMTGDMIIRIAQGVAVQRGDLLMSAGDGTAKPQGDDIIRSKTVAKVTSNHVTCTYEDGSYCVPCVLMAC